MHGTSCPDSEELVAFSLGQLGSDSTEIIAEHVLECAVCQAVLNDDTKTADPLLAVLRKLPEATTNTFDKRFEAEIAELSASGSMAWPPIRAGESGPPPERLGEYRILTKLGEGGMGTVYRAVHTRLDKVVALKVLLTHRSARPEALIRFQREMKAVGRLNHANIVQATDAGESGGTSFLVMEYVPGADLGKVVRHHTKLRIADACEIIRQAALGLAHAHNAGLIHRDLKPSNLLLTPYGQVKILDLGLALLLDQSEPDDETQSDSSGADDHLKSPDATATHAVLGSFDYMAPEQAADPRAVVYRSDVYGLGCTLYHLLTGEVPYPAPQYAVVVDKMKAHAIAPVPSLGVARPDVPKELSAILERMMAKDPAGRPGAADVARFLRPFTGESRLPELIRKVLPDTTEQEAETASVIDASWNRKLPRPRRTRLWPIGLAVLGLLLVTGVIIVWSNRVLDRPQTVLATPQTSTPLVTTPEKDDNAPAVVLLPKARLKGHTEWVYSLSFNKDGTRLASGSEDGTVRIWDTAKGEIIRVLEDGRLVSCVAYSPDGKTVASAAHTPGDSGDVYLWNTDTGIKTILKGIRGGTLGLAFSPNGQWLAASGKYNAVRVWNLAFNVSSNLPDDQEGLGRRLAFSRDGRFLAVAGSNLSIWNVDTWSKRSFPLTDRVSGLGLSTDAKLLALAFWQIGTISYFDVPSEDAPIQELLPSGAGWQAHQTFVNDVTFSPNDRLLATTGTDRVARIWDVRRRRSVAVLQGHTAQTDPVVFAPDGKILATGSATGDNTVILWDVSALGGQPGKP